MKLMKFKAPGELVEDVLNAFCLDEEFISSISVDNIVIVAKFDVMENIFKQICGKDYTNLLSVDFSDETFEGYEDEYSLYIDNDFNVIVEKAKVDGVYLQGCGDIVLIHQDCNSKVINTFFDDPIMIEFSFIYEE